MSPNNLDSSLSHSAWHFIWCTLHQFSRSVTVSPWTAACQASLSFTISHGNSRPLSPWCHPTIHPLSPASPALNLSQHHGLFQWVSSLHHVAEVLEFQLQYQFLHWIFRVDFLSDWLAWSHCRPKDSQESYPAPQFENVNSLALRLHEPALTAIHDYWINHSFY